MSPALILLLASPLLAAAPAGKSEMSQDITVKAKASGPPMALPPPTPARAVVDEVLDSLPLGRGEGRAGPETVRVTPESTRLERPFPEPPFLALSPENIRALYDSWTFDVRAVDGEIVYRSEGIGLAREKLDWDGEGSDGRLALIPGRRYRYRFTGRRGGREFEVLSDPVLIKSYAHREYAGETRLEVVIDEVFTDGKATFATGAERYLDAMTDALRAGEPRRDGTYLFELASAAPRSKLTAAREKALRARLAAALKADPAKVRIAPRTAARGEWLAVLVPPSKGPRLRIE